MGGTILQNFEAMELDYKYILTALIISMATLLVFYVFRSVGLYTLAKRQKVKGAGIAWVPFFWMYIACKLIKKAKMFNRPFEKWALLFGILFAVSELLSTATEVISYLPLLEYSLIGKNLIYVVTDSTVSIAGYTEYIVGSRIFVADSFIPYGYSFELMNTILTTIGYISPIFSIAGTIISVFVFINLFKTYWPNHYTLASILSIFVGLFPIFVFVIRNKDAVDFNDYLRARYNMYYGNPYANNPNAQNGYNPYNQYNQYNQNNQSQGYANQERPERPFENYSNPNTKPPEPFEDFDKKDDN